MIVKPMTEHHLEFQSLKGGCTGLPESPLVKIPHCWKSHVAAQVFCFIPHSLALFSAFLLLFYALLTHHLYTMKTISDQKFFPLFLDLSCVQALVSL